MPAHTLKVGDAEIVSLVDMPIVCALRNLLPNG